MTCIPFSHGAGKGRFSGILCVDSGVGPFRITVGNKRWWFEWSDRWGPLRVRKDGGSAEQPGWRSPFWRAACIWNAQGRRTNLQSAIWHEPPPITHYYRQIGKRTRVLVETIEPPGSIEGYSEEMYVAIASADTRPEGGDGTKIAAPFTSGAVGVAETPNSTPMNSPHP
jgi:hypothetical protein